MKYWYSSSECLRTLAGAWCPPPHPRQHCYWCSFIRLSR